MSRTDRHGNLRPRSARRPGTPPRAKRLDTYARELRRRFALKRLREAAERRGKP